MVHAGSKSSKRGKGGGGGRWGSGGGKWNDKVDRWSSSSPDYWSSSSPDNGWGGDDDKYDDDDVFPGGGNRMPICTLANPVQEQWDQIIRTWRLAYLASNANAALIQDFGRETAWHANLMMEKFMEVVEGYEYDDFDTDDIFDLGEMEGKDHPASVKFTNDRQEDAICALTKALVLMMRDSCFYNRWKRTFEIVAFYYMEGFIEGIDNGMKLKQCVDWDNVKDTRLNGDNDRMAYKESTEETKGNRSRNGRKKNRKKNPKLL